MMARQKQMESGGGKRPSAQGSWLAGMLIGMTVTNLATGAMMAGAGAAIGKAILGGTLPKCGVRCG